MGDTTHLIYCLTTILVDYFMTVSESGDDAPTKPAAPPEATGAPVPPVPQPIPATPPVVGIGASAGGLEAFEGFFRACPDNTGMAFVLVSHLAPSHESLLAGILQRSTNMPVVQAEDQATVEANHVYIIPPNREMAMLNGELYLSLPELAHGRRMPIDNFFRSLAADVGEHAVGIILSGTADDGTQGLRAISAANGITMVQDPATAKYDSMPQSAIAAGCVNHVLSVEQMPARLQELRGKAQIKPRARTIILPEKTVSGISRILLELRACSGHDFSLYKKSTIGRRIQRRMVLHQIDDELVYARFIKQNPGEARLLFRELLINVTGFFRDPEAFVALKKTILPDLLAKCAPGELFRVWVAGCSTGEEAYSIAMILHELQVEMWAGEGRELPIQIFATDLDDEAITVARAGRYPGTIAQDMTPERLRRYFTNENDGTFRIKKEIRDMVVFAVQNVIKDPPFMRLDLLSCRNLMIYLEPELQMRLLATFRYALRTHGILFLSTSESVTNQPDLFLPLDRKWKFYQVRPNAVTGKPDSLSPLYLTTFQMVKTGDAAIASTEKIHHAAVESHVNIADLSNLALLNAWVPPSVVIDDKGNILYVHGDTGRYLRPAPGILSNNVVDMAREGLQPVLRNILLNGAAMLPVDKDVSVKTNGGFSQVRVKVQKLPAAPPGRALMLISFVDIITRKENPDMSPGAWPASDDHAAGQDTANTESTRIQDLEHKLIVANQLLQSTHEEQQAFNEELKSTNEELQSTNEELQSSNEELETSKEELQSLNEETVTVNAELNARIEQLTSIQNDMKNLLDSVGTGTLFLDHHCAIRRYTPAAAKIYRLISSDLGRPLSDITSSLDASQHQQLLAGLQTVLDTLIPIEHEVRTSDGAWYLARIQPYRTFDNVIEGVVLTFTAISNLKQAYTDAQQVQAKLESATREIAHLALELADGIINTVVEPLVVLDADLQIVSVNKSFCDCFKMNVAETTGRKIHDLGDRQWLPPALQKLLEDVLPKNQVIEGYVVEHNFATLGLLRMVLNARRITTTSGATELILLALVAIEPVVRT
jgi:two-component system CheB/CheR fusion protein